MDARDAASVSIAGDRNHGDLIAAFQNARELLPVGLSATLVEFACLHVGQPNLSNGRVEGLTINHCLDDGSLSP